MRHRLPSPKPYLQLLAILLILLSLPRSKCESMQGMTVAILAPTWNQLSTIKQGILHLTEESAINEKGETVYVNEEIQKLNLENQLLKNEITKLQEFLKQESLIEESAMQPLHIIREHEREIIVNKELESLPAQVIFRSSGSWNTILWINVGEAHNQLLEKQVISKNSPVVVGKTVVGVVDYVGTKQSRVRLITDSSLNPSVRAVRIDGGSTWYLAKGELKGSSSPQYRTKSSNLSGTGFNYDFSDHEGPARDLRSGAVIGHQSENYPPLPIILPGDLLITTGMDGVFPPGLSVATVSEVKMLKEGDYYYDIEALPCCGNLDHLTLVSVLPSQGFDPFDQPPRY